MGKKVCFNCGASNPSDSMFCSKCGYDLRKDDYGFNDNNNYCSKCGTGNPKEAKFCAKCGNNLNGGGPSIKPLPVLESKTKKCPHCKASMNIDTVYCPSCGKLYEEPKHDDDLVRCPKCGSTAIGFVRYEDNDNYNVCDGVCGAAMCGPLGLLCGLKEKKPGKTVRKCKKCNHEF